MTWADKHRPLLEKIRAYASDFAGIKPTVLEYFEGGSKEIFPLKAESDRGSAMLLIYCALRQNISEELLMGFLAHLWKEYGPDILRLNHLGFAELQGRVDAFPGLREWSLRSKVPGILRSACDFFFRRGRLGQWLRNTRDGEECVRILSEEIFMMGKTSEFRYKPRRFLWLMTRLPGAEPETFWTEDTLLCPTAGHSRLLRELGPLKGRRIPWTTPAEKIAYHNRFHHLVAPGRTYLVAAGFDAYLEPHPEEKWQCRKLLGGCANCVLVSDCPGSDL